MAAEITVKREISKKVIKKFRGGREVNFNVLRTIYEFNWWIVEKIDREVPTNLLLKRPSKNLIWLWWWV